MRKCSRKGIILILFLIIFSYGNLESLVYFIFENEVLADPPAAVSFCSLPPFVNTVVKPNMVIMQKNQGSLEPGSLFMLAKRKGWDSERARNGSWKSQEVIHKKLLPPYLREAVSCLGQRPVVEKDALLLTGRIVAVYDLRKFLTSEELTPHSVFYEPVVLKIKIYGTCRGSKFFLVKKGINTTNLTPGTMVEFYTNYNKCFSKGCFMLIGITNIQEKEEQL